MSNYPAARIVWIDCEMTGLDVQRHGLTEVAVIITDFDLQPVHPGFEIIINPGTEALANMNDFVTEMHTASGLLPKIAAGATVAEAERQLCAYVREHISGSSRPLVAGNTIGMDRRFLSHYMPDFDALLHYRSIDVSTIKELARRWFPASYEHAPVKHGGHRALADIAESIRELAYFRDTVFVAHPGPDAAAARQQQSSTVANFAALVTGSGASEPAAASAPAADT